MIITKTQICNMAIGELGGQLIADFDTDTTPVANLCRLYYPLSLKTLLEDMPYTFAMKRVNLVAHVIDPSNNLYAYRFQLPDDFIQIVEVEDQQDYRIDGSLLLSHSLTVWIRYVYALENTAEMSGHFITALMALMTIHLCMPITRHITYVEVFEKRYEKVLLMARGRDSQQEPALSYEPSTLTNVRF